MNIEILPKILLFLCLADIAIGMDNDFTVDIPAGHQSCFFETIKTRNIEFEVEYQVKFIQKKIFLSNILAKNNQTHIGWFVLFV